MAVPRGGLLKFRNKWDGKVPGSIPKMLSVDALTYAGWHRTDTLVAMGSVSGGKTVTLPSSAGVSEAGVGSLAAKASISGTGTVLVAAKVSRAGAGKRFLAAKATVSGDGAGTAKAKARVSAAGTAALAPRECFFEELPSRPFYKRFFFVPNSRPMA